jgi:hypothetical protein
MKYFILFLLTLPAFAAYENPDEAFELTPEERDPDNTEVNRRSEKYKWDEALVAPYNSDLGIRDTTRYTGKDRNKLSFAFHLNGQYEHLQQLQALEFTWLRRSDAWHKLWWGASFRRTNTQFNNISEDAGSAGETGFDRPADSDQIINTLGLGWGYRFKLLLDFFKTEDTFESVQVFANYTNLAEGHTGDNYAGYGMTADYGLHKRTRSSFFWGGKFTYNMAWVTGPEDDRDLTLGWYTFALEAGFFY